MSGRGTASPRVWARTAGALYLIVFIAGPLTLAINATIIDSDAARTAENLRANEHLFRLGFVANLIATIAYIGVVALLYRVFQPAGRALSVVSAFFGLVGCAVSAAAMTLYLAPIFYLGDSAYLGALAPEALQAHARIAWRFSALGNSVGLVFFGCYCLSLALLVLRARFVPRFLAIFLGLAGIAWLTGNFLSFLAPDYAVGVSQPMIAAGGIGELVFTLWLVVVGVHAERWREQAAEAAP